MPNFCDSFCDSWLLIKYTGQVSVPVLGLLKQGKWYGVEMEKDYTHTQGRTQLLALSTLGPTTSCFWPAHDLVQTLETDNLYSNFCFPFASCASLSYLTSQLCFLICNLGITTGTHREVMIGWAAASKVTSTVSLPPAPHTSTQYIVALLSFEMCFLQILKYATTLRKATPFKNKFHSNVHKSRILEPREIVEILQHSFSLTFL